MRINWSFNAIALLAAISFVTCGSRATAQIGISGTLSNFDCYNETPEDAYGAEIEIEGVHSNEIYSTYPSHYNSISNSEYTSGSVYGTRIRFEGYNFNSNPANLFLPPTTNPMSTNGHFCVGTMGCEHFGFSATVQPTAQRFFWLNQNNQRINTAPLVIPAATWVYMPNGGGQANVQAIVEVPELENQNQLPDSVWIKVYEIEHEQQVMLGELVSGGDLVPEDGTEIETEWELLEGGVQFMNEGNVGDNIQSVVRRYEYFAYTGAYDPENHEPISNWNGNGDPPANELGDFIAANMVAINIGERGGPIMVGADSVTLIHGEYVAGGVPELASSDNLDYQLRRLSGDVQSRTEFEVQSVSPNAAPVRFEFTLEGSGFFRSDVTQTIEFFDYTQGTWELVDSQPAARFVDSTTIAVGTGDLSRFVEPGTLSIKTRIRYLSAVPRQNFASNTDQTFWTIQ
jgi:hypothetical protein